MRDCNCQQGRGGCECSPPPLSRDTDIRVACAAVVLLVAAVMLSGCSSVPSAPETLVTCDVTRQRAFVLNHLKAVAVGLEVAPHQVSTLCAVPVTKAGSAP